MDSLSGRSGNECIPGVGGYRVGVDTRPEIPELRRSSKDTSSRQLTDALRRVWRAAAEQGDTLPPEAQLAIDLGVSRSKLREALVRLEAEGLVARRPGSATYANPVALDLPMRLDESFEFSDMLREAGHVPRVEVLDCGRVDLQEADATILGVTPGSSALRTVKRWYSDERCAAVAIDLVPWQRAQASQDDPRAMTVFEQVEWVGGERVEWECAWPGVRVAGAVDAELLGVADGDPLFTLELVGVGRGGGRGFLAREQYVPGVVHWGLIRTVRRS